MFSLLYEDTPGHSRPNINLFYGSTYTELIGQVRKELCPKALEDGRLDGF